jgi:5-methyltetrahydrofolate--homocysteine methyltransferase
MATILGEFSKEGWLNLVGGCCGSTPEHIAAIAKAVRDSPMHRVSGMPAPVLRLSGLEPMALP